MVHDSTCVLGVDAARLIQYMVHDSTCVLGVHAALHDLVCYKRKLFAIKHQFCTSMGSDRDMDNDPLYHEIRYASWLQMESTVDTM